MADSTFNLKDSTIKNHSMQSPKIVLHEMVSCNEKINQKDEISTDTIFTVIVTLSIFIIGIIIDRLIKWFDNFLKRKKFKSYFKYHLIKVSTALIPKLRDGYRKFYQITDVNSGITITPPKVLSSDFERLLHIDNSELFHAFKEKDVLSKVLSQLDFVSKIQNEVDNFHAVALNQSGQLREDLKKLADEYISLLAKYGEFEKDKKGVTNTLFTDSVFYYYHELAGKRKLTDFYRKIIRPVQEHLVSSGLYKTHPKATEIAEMGRRISHVYGELRHRSVEVRIQYRVFSKYMDETCKNLNELLTKLK